MHDHSDNGRLAFNPLTALPANEPDIGHACGIHTLEEGIEAFAARYYLAMRAEKTLDVQYYLWENDLSGGLLFQALWDAAERGVIIRLLLDDNNTRGLDETLQALDAHPHITVKLFNPFSFRSLRMLGYLTDFARLNRRMHNKSFTVDGAATIIGGRNIGDAYFGLGDEPQFADLDVLAIGPVVAEVETDFERYWQCDSVSALRHVLGTEVRTSDRTHFVARDGERAAEVQGYLDKLAGTAVAQQMQHGELSFIKAMTKLLSDDPRKGEGKALPRMLLPERLLRVMGTPETQIDIISSYFVPGRAGVAQILQLVRKGVKVSILTNSLAANDVAIVHAGYARWRRKLLRHGVELYELKPTRKQRPGLRDRGLTGNSGSSLHAKTFSIDGKKVFIGSFNFDPRSALLNTEMGLVIDSEQLAQRIHHRFLRSQHDTAWQLRLTRWGKIHWIEWEEGRVRELKNEPETTLWRRFLVLLAYWLPVEWLL